MTELKLVPASAGSRTPAVPRNYIAQVQAALDSANELLIYIARERIRHGDAYIALDEPEASTLLKELRNALRDVRLSDARLEHHL